MAGEPVQRRLQFVLEYYDMRPIDNVILNYFGLANEVFTITTAAGKFVIKNCFKNNTEALVANEAALIQHLNQQGIPCPQLVPTKDGHAYLHFDGHYYIMTEFLEGYIPNWEEALSEGVAKATIKAMADFHHATADYFPPQPDGRIGSLNITAAIEWINSLQQQLQHAPQERESVTKMQALSDRMLQHAQSLSIELNNTDLSPLEEVYIHGDLHCFNLVFNAEKTEYTGVLDFDFIRRDYRLYDFFWCTRSIMFNYFFPQQYGHLRDDSKPPTLEQVQSMSLLALPFMVKEYRRYHPLSNAELALLPLMIKALPLMTVRFFNLNNSEEECLEHIAWFSWQMDNIAESVAAYSQALDPILATN